MSDWLFAASMEKMDRLHEPLAAWMQECRMRSESYAGENDY